MGELATWAAVVVGHTALLLVATFGTSQAPFRRAGAPWSAFDWPRRDEVQGPLLTFFALYWGVIAVHVLGVQLDPLFTAWAGRDHARDLYALEGDAVASFQALQHPVLDAVFLVAYLFGYPFMIYFAPLFYLAHRDARALRLAALSFVVLYALTLPFYIALPISNPWAVAGEPWYQGRTVEFGLGRLAPDLVPSYWQFTTPNNELPSLHAAISAMTALVAWRSGYRRFAAFAGAFAVLIPVSSFYLGVHWIVDAVVGEAFAVIAVAVGVRLAARSEATQPAPAAQAPGAVDLEG